MTLEQRKPEDLSGEEAAHLLSLMDRVDALSEARTALEAIDYRDPHIKGRYLVALVAVQREARAALSAYRREVGLER